MPTIQELIPDDRQHEVAVKTREGAGKLLGELWMPSRVPRELDQITDEAGELVAEAA